MVATFQVESYERVPTWAQATYAYGEATPPPSWNVT